MDLRMIYFLLLSTIYLCTVSCEPKTKSIISNYKTYKKDGFINIPQAQGSYRIELINTNIIETSFIPKGEEYNPISHAVVLDESFKGDLVENDSVLVYGSKGIQIKITKNPWQISYYYKDRPLISENKGYIKTDSTEILNFKLSQDEKIYGAGSRAMQINRRGKRLQLYNRAHYGYETQSELMNYTLPLLLSSKTYAIHFDNAPIGYLDIDSKGNDQLSYETISGRKTYQIVAGDDWYDLMDQYTTLTGKQPLPPQWALGNFASRFGYHSQKEVEETISKFKKDSIPLDAVILDIFWFGKDIKGPMGNLEFLKDSFPEPKKMITDLKKQNVKTVLITEPFILSTSNKWDEAIAQDILAKDSIGNPFTYDFYFGNTGLIDIYSDQGASWFWNIYKRYVKDYGVAGWWGDLGEPEVHPADMRHAKGTADEVHNIYGHDWAKLIYQGYQNDFPDQRPFILMRAGYSGSQRFGMIPWSGDVSRSWGGLKAQTQIALSMGIQGLGYMHSDLGGFAGGEQFDAELYTRWLQYGVFQPIYRPHAQEHIAPEPVFHDKMTKKLAKEAISLRYQLLPYNYTLAFENHQKGLPLMRPLFFQEPDNSKIASITDTYFWGSDFLVSPVVSSGVVSKDVYFPSGVWFDFFSGTRYEGDRFHTVDVVSDHIPVFVRAGAFIPKIKTILSTEAYTSEQLDLHYYYDASIKNSKGQIYRDDGSTPEAYKKGQYELMQFISSWNQKTLDITFKNEIGKAYKPFNRKINLILHHFLNAPVEIKLGDKVLNFDYNAATREVVIPILWNSQDTLDIKIVL